MVRSLGRFDVYFVCFIISDLSRSDIPENTASELEYTATDTDSSGHDGFIAVFLSHVLSTWRVHSTHAQRYSIACRSREDKKIFEACGCSTEPTRTSSDDKIYDIWTRAHLCMWEV